ncbi:AtpZ/AtpI family protein [bacterium]|nr:AtpZ/AtpI family protein [bacterium]
MKLPGVRPRRDGKEDRASYGGWVDLAMQTAITLALSVIVLTLFGRWLDGLFGTYPLLLVIGALWGAAGGTVWVVLRVKQYADAQERKQHEDSSEDRE